MQRTITKLPKNFLKFNFTLDDVYNIMTDPFYISSGSVTILDNQGKNPNLPEGCYKTRLAYLRDNFLLCNTLVLRNLENYNDTFKAYVKLKGPGTTIHCNVNPLGGRSYGRHFDSSDVLLKMQYGSKTLLFWENDVQKEIRLEEGDSVLIPTGLEHEAINETAGIALSLGTENVSDSKDVEIPKKTFLEMMRL